MGAIAWRPRTLTVLPGLPLSPTRGGSETYHIQGLHREMLGSMDDVNSPRRVDVTAEMVDLDARIASAAASVERTRALLAQAKTIAEIVSVEAELAKRESALEQLEGQRRLLEAQVTLATITVDLSVRVPPAPPAEDGGDEGLPGPLEALAAGGRSVVAVGTVVLVALAWVLPWVPVAAAVAAVALWVRRRRTSPAASPAS